MILANLAKAVREQNYYAVALEFLIVIAGVVIGFQITEWRGEQANREAERIYLARLYRDMEQSVCRIRHEQGSVVQWNERAGRTLDALLLNEADAVEDTGFELVASTRIQTGSPFRATLNELVSGGQMNLISNEFLRAHIAEVDAELTSYAEYIQILVNAQGASVDVIHSRLRPVAGNPYQITYDFEALAQDERFINSLGLALRRSRTNSAWLGHMADAAESLRLAVGEEIGRDVSEVPDCSRDGEDS